MTPILLAFLTCIFLTINSILARAGKAVGYPLIQYVIDFCCFAGILYLIGFIYIHFFTSQPYMMEEIVFMSIAGSIIFLAFITLNAALLTGKGALAMAIS